MFSMVLAFRRLARPLCASLVLLGLAACDKPVAVGDINNLVVATPDSVWEALESDIEAALEPRTFTVRDERVFNVAHVSPTEADWGRLQHVRQVLLIGEPADPWVAEALNRVEGAVPTPPTVVQAQNVWAQNQSVTVLLLRPASPPSAAKPLLEEAGQLLVDQLTSYARRRMFVTGVDSVRSDSLEQIAGFTFRLPKLYDLTEPRPGVYMFRNDNPDPATLIRTVTVASRRESEVAFAPEAALEWRREVASQTTQPAQITEPELVATRRLEVNGRQALEIQGVWANPPGDWPAAGPFLTRLVQCPERTFLVDAWLYAPGKAKYEYMVQLQTILDSFRCSPPAA